MNRPCCRGLLTPEVKLVVENGEMTISMMNTALVWALVDFSIESGGEYPAAEQRFVGTADVFRHLFHAGILPCPSATCLLCIRERCWWTAMGGQLSDKGNYDKIYECWT